MGKATAPRQAAAVQDAFADVSALVMSVVAQSAPSCETTEKRRDDLESAA
jgi:hypothetical protein